ncbi:HlyD family efflux transporter periplasmic adaptor subunit [Anaerotignum lactatifermentans]|uniref:HlyD family efflux transporter periplasmic adaptor subunit n=1 Tax=Anaerotignum lactatifermentans TaxID=160404 RepID=A0ABS2GDQ8_9FIRM|nr:HlyD family efflux transporter periplasmic adaptor subunit [Anaerotignum lactatifermentans]MBM6830037.1 HlyD family efflux transporter periplasmic adaptor subunit [Anaerotignum lactatifermentans]MBM6878629.1 HlyD family efflux transporter periplasmic adaptor subunit [Anaerotignum lactatifermentans]MBM6951658.1 HlyD family efflux transporter periplasmic adaptor subunit [Anaerotignum lactatifermentans]
MKLTKKKILLGVAIAVVVIGGAKMALGAKNAKPAGTPVMTAAVTKGDLSQTLKQKAVLEGTESIEVVSKLHYKIQELLVKEGDKVTKGQLLAVLDSSNLQQEISLTQGDLKLLEYQQQETLDSRQKEYDNALAVKNEAQKAYDKAAALYKAGAGTEQEMDNAKSTLEKAQRDLDAIPTENGKAVLTDSERQTRSNTLQKASVQAQTLNDCQIRSSISGTVTRVNTKVGRFADETENSKPMFVIEDIDHLQMKVLVSENDIDQVEVGQKVEIRAEILEGDTVSGVVERISPTGEQKNSSSSERVIPVYIRVEGENEKLIAGITAEATILIASAKDALIVPIEAVGQQVDGTTAVYTVTEEGVVHIVPVTVGLETDLEAELKDCQIPEGTKVILNPSANLTEGMMVAVQ